MLVAGYMFMCVVTILFFPHTAIGTIPRAEDVKGVVRTMNQSIASRLKAGTSVALSNAEGLLYVTR